MGWHGRRIRRCTTGTGARVAVFDGKMLGGRSYGEADFQRGYRRVEENGNGREAFSWESAVESLQRMKTSVNTTNYACPAKSFCDLVSYCVSSQIENGETSCSWCWIYLVLNFCMLFVLGMMQRCFLLHKHATGYYDDDVMNTNRNNMRTLLFF
jgi:hypothetical protein